MFESCKALSLNSHETVVEISAKKTTSLIHSLRSYLEKKQIAFPQLLDIDQREEEAILLATGPSEIISATKTALANHPEFKLSKKELSTVTLTCTGSTSPEVMEQAMSALENAKVNLHKIMVSPMSITALIDSSARKEALQALHALI
jgi:aspartate kinase